MSLMYGQDPADWNQESMNHAGDDVMDGFRMDKGILVEDSYRNCLETITEAFPSSDDLQIIRKWKSSSMMKMSTHPERKKSSSTLPLFMNFCSIAAWDWNRIGSARSHGELRRRSDG